MLAVKNVGGWVLALVALSMFGLLLLRGLSDKESASREEQVSAGMVMTGNARATVADFSAAFEAISAQYLPGVVTIGPYPFAGAPAGANENPWPTRDEGKSRFGCGILVSNDGYILTNRHILPTNFLASDSISIQLNRERRFTGLVVGSDSLTDLAVIKISAKNLPYAKFGDSDRLRIGQWVVAIGNAGSVSHAITTGIISAKGRSKVMLPQLDDLIRIDAPIHNSSALVDLEGDLVGISTTLFAGSGPHLDGGLAIPSNLARRIMQSLIKEGKVTRGYIGATAQDLDHSLAKALHLNSTLGALLVEVAASSPAEGAGLRRGDVVLQFAGTVIDDAKVLENAVAAQIPGKNVQAVFWRDSVKVSCEVIPGERPGEKTETPVAVVAPTKSANKLGIHVQSLTGEMARQGRANGVVVSQIEPDSPAVPILFTGDVIQEINRKPIKSVRDFRAALQTLNAGETALLLVCRGEKKFFAGVETR